MDRLRQNLVRAGAVSAIAVLLSSACWAAQYPQDPAQAATRYLSARQKLHIMGQVGPEALAASDALPKGAVVELTGEIVGHTAVHRANQTTFCLLLRTVEGLTVSLDCTEHIEGLAVGETVQVLASVPEQDTERRHFQLDYLVRQCDLPAEARRPATMVNQSNQQPTSPQTDSPTNGPSASPTDVEPGSVDWATRLAPSPPETQPGDNQQQQEITRWAGWVKQHNAKLTDTECELIVRWVRDYSRLYGVDHRLIFAVIKAESDFDPTCVSHAGAVGLMQLMPSTARTVHVSNRWNVQENIRGGIQYLSQQLARYKGRSNYEQCVLGLACYNAGPNAVKKYGGVPPYDETRRYVIKVTNTFYNLVKQGYP